MKLVLDDHDQWVFIAYVNEDTWCVSIKINNMLVKACILLETYLW